jgi:surface polysaccharide O-acyltransferase-like enzyme
MVVLVHAASKYSPLYGQIPQSGWWAANIIASASHSSVPLFIMLSGFLLIPQKKSQNTKAFLTKRFKRVGLPLLFWIPIYAVFYHILRGDSLNPLWIIKRFIFDQPYEHLYFLVVLLELAIITPWLSKIYNKLDNKQRFFLTTLMLLISVFWKPWRLIIPLFIPFIGYYLAGSLFNKYHIKINLQQTFFWILSSFLISTIGTYFLVKNSSPDRNGLYFYTFFNPTVLISSLLIFNIFKISENKLKINYLLKKISNLTLGIYLIHPIVLGLFSFDINLNSFSLTFFYIFFISIVGFIISALISQIFKHLPYFKYTV